MTVEFTCRACGAAQVPVTVRDREPEESLRAWMAAMQRTVGFAHGRSAPQCKSRHVDLKLPVTPEQPIGSKPAA